ncbi:hypothetical protein ERO13_A04G025300v2 [Gossypium hirsutum]|uniref:Uncharacterized protein n=4 Tax=Gossypium TaxID=3633 RepID=A0A5J5NEB0_GOSBA|nr:hypothetical protein ES319_1Z111600v1 [Gossypium barbadense]KAG4204072.1 hypothetical protein ERO13_A04G025300v2 [Gossypium hirsutum]TXG74609.1 hypothetical protein ES288_1Z027400v1 [Gossypium darwinii]TYI32077.1 hypothetical protein ES332_A04G033200v1 [Gossypium tomentosum]TYJ38935.1 hypothetical protein E1A91_A04G029400v1 [Gossypium mustelinum]
MPQWLSQHQRHFRWPTTPRNESFDPDPRLYSDREGVKRSAQTWGVQ